MMNMKMLPVERIHTPSENRKQTLSALKLDEVTLKLWIKRIKIVDLQNLFVLLLLLFTFYARLFHLKNRKHDRERCLGL